MMLQVMVVGIFLLLRSTYLLICFPFIGVIVPDVVYVAISSRFEGAAGEAGGGLGGTCVLPVDLGSVDD